ncbi:MAG: hypothetical protein AAFY42_12590, partial [Pseudomonadota bacterium]
MSRKTYSYSAAAIAAVAGLSFSSADGAAAFAQDLIASDAAVEAQGPSIEGPNPEGDAIEIVPQTPSSQDTVFVSNEVVQPIAEPESPTKVEVSSLRELVSSIDEDAALTEQLR